MKPLRAQHFAILFIGLIIGLIIGCGANTPIAASQDNQPEWEYAYGWGILETEGDAITLYIPELETVDSDWGEIEAYKKIEFGIGFEGGAVGTEMYAVNRIADLGWELVCKYYIPEGWEKGHHYWFRRIKE